MQWFMGKDNARKTQKVILNKNEFRIMTFLGNRLSNVYMKDNTREENHWRSSAIFFVG